MEFLWGPHTKALDHYHVYVCGGPIPLSVGIASMPRSHILRHRGFFADRKAAVPTAKHEYYVRHSMNLRRDPKVHRFHQRDNTDGQHIARDIKRPS